MPLLVIAIVVQAVLLAFCADRVPPDDRRRGRSRDHSRSRCSPLLNAARVPNAAKYLGSCLSVRYDAAMPTADAAQLDRAFHALADESRRAMVVRLSRGAASVSELAAPLDMSLPSVMQHLDVLQRSGVVRSEKVGRVRRCRLEPGPMRTLEQWIAEHRAIWERHFDRVSDVLDDAFPTDQGDRR